MKLSVSAYRAHASAHKKILTSSYQQHYGSTAAPPICNPLQPPNFTPQVSAYISLLIWLIEELLSISLLCVVKNEL